LTLALKRGKWSGPGTSHFIPRGKTAEKWENPALTGPWLVTTSILTSILIPDRNKKIIINVIINDNSS
jgi:hypothetical protein